MDFTKTKSEVVADIFVKQMRQVSRQSYRESASDTALSNVVLHQGSVPHIARELEASRSEPNFVAMINWLALSNLGWFFEPLKPIQKYISEESSGFSRKIFQLDLARVVGQECHWLAAARAAMISAQCETDLYVVMTRCVFGLNKMGQHKRAQNCALMAYTVSQYLEERSFIQRSEFAILHSTRLAGGTDVSVEYARVCKQLVSGELEFALLNQCLVPTYAAMHLMDLNRDSKDLRALIGLSKEYVKEDFTSINNKIAVARYNFLTGRRREAKTQVHELIEGLCLSAVDLPVLRPLLSMAKELGVSEEGLVYPWLSHAPQKQWLRFDMGLDKIWVDWELDHQLA